MGNLFQWQHLLILLVIILLLFGAAKLPALAKSVGQSARVFKKEMKAMKEEDGPDSTATAADAPSPADRLTSNEPPSPEAPRTS